jgi:acetamidase/formamidase
MSKVHQYNPTFYYYTFGTHPAAVEVEPGDTIITPTVDSRNSDFQGNQIPLSMRHHDPGNPPCEVNPLGGPFPVEGAQAGDSLRVTVKRIEMTRDYAVSRFSAGYGGARDESLLTVGFMSYYEPYQWEIDVDKGECTLDICGRKATVPLRPFLGTIGTAPRFGESLSPLVPAEHGGNMDCQGITKGAVLFLPVFAEEGAPDAGRCPCGTRRWPTVWGCPRDCGTG